MSEKRYRDLEVGETLQSTDEYWPNGSSGWSRVSECGIDLGIGRGISLQKFFRFRRPVAEPTCEHIFRLNGKCSKCGADYQEPVVRDSLTTENGGEVGTPEDELRRWQDGIRDAILKRYPSANIDGKGCDSGDPLDFTLSEINQGFQFVEKERDEWRTLLQHATNVLTMIPVQRLGTEMAREREIFFDRLNAALAEYEALRKGER